MKTAIIIASDHNGNELREYLRKTLLLNHYVIDIGPVDKTEKVDYVKYAQQVGHAVSTCSIKGILICGTGIGMSIVANRFEGVRASMVTDVDTAIKTREHNNSNVLVLGAWQNTKEEAIDIVNAWLNQDFGYGRHIHRVASIDKKGVILVPGYFDVLNGEHIKLLKYAKNFGKVVVALNSDKSAELNNVKLHNNFKDRRELLEEFVCIDEIICNDEETVRDIFASKCITHILKGPEYTQEYVRKNDCVPINVEVIIYQV
jgi:ribose 5-phosphate isomerase B